MDKYTKAVLTVIAVCLVIQTTKDVPLIGKAHADRMVQSQIMVLKNDLNRKAEELIRAIKQGLEQLDSTQKRELSNIQSSISADVRRYCN